MYEKKREEEEDDREKEIGERLDSLF